MSTTAARAPAAAEVDQWLAQFEEALTHGDPTDAAELFTPRAIGGIWSPSPGTSRPWRAVDGVRYMLEHTLGHTRPRGWSVTEESAAADGVTEAWLALETEVGRGQGHLRLVDGKAWTLLTTLEELRDHGEVGRRAGCRPSGGGTSSGARQASLEIADDRAKNARCKKAGPQRTGPILTELRKLQ